MFRRTLGLAATLVSLPLPALAATGPRITAAELAEALTNTPDRYLVVDVRSGSEWRAPGGHIAGAVHVPYPGIKSTAADQVQPEPGQTVVLICFTGHRSQWSMQAVQEATGGPVVDLKGGMLAWWARSLPVVVEPEGPVRQTPPADDDPGVAPTDGGS